MQIGVYRRKLSGNAETDRLIIGATVLYSGTSFHTQLVRTRLKVRRAAIIMRISFVRVHLLWNMILVRTNASNDDL